MFILEVLCGAIYFLRTKFLKMINDRFVEPAEIRWAVIDAAMGYTDSPNRQMAREEVFNRVAGITAWWYTRQKFLTAVIGFGTVSAALIGSVILIRQNEIIAQQAMLLCRQNEFLSRSNKFSVAAEQTKQRFNAVSELTILTGRIGQVRNYLTPCTLAKASLNEKKRCVEHAQKTLLSKDAQADISMEQFGDELRSEIGGFRSSKERAVTEMAILGRQALEGNEIAGKAIASYRDRLKDLNKQLTSVRSKLRSGATTPVRDNVDDSNCNSLLQKARL